MKPLFVAMLLLLMSCQSDDDVINYDLDGNYTGIFERGNKISTVEINLNNGMFSGSSEEQKFPGICRGTFSHASNTITFKNECPWTLEFDWTLILSGEWTINVSNNTLTLENSLGDHYNLVKTDIQVGNK
ncbi:MAG: hypothetical protein WA951_06240 [Leeuwenhoekiella sp.]